MLSTFFSAVPTSRTSFQIALEFTIYCPCFQRFISSSNFKNIVSISVRIHHLSSLLSTFFSAVPTSRTSFQIALEFTIYRPCFHYFSAVPNRFKYRQNAPFIVLVFIISLQFQIVSKTVRMHHLPSLFSFISLQFQIVSNTVRMHALDTLFSLFLCSFKSFQILSECML